MAHSTNIQPIFVQRTFAPSHIPELDGIRGFAAILVMMSHYPTWPAIFPDFFRDKISVVGQCGVSLFFCLSGFLITRILLASKNQPHYFKNFYARRTLRIFPLYYLVTLLTFFVFPLLSPSGIPPFTDQLYTYLFMQDFPITFGWRYAGPSGFWSLAVEEHFYLFWPLIIYATNTKKLLITALAAIIAISILTRVLLANNGYEVFFFTFSRLDELALGSLMAVFGFGSTHTLRARLCLSVMLPGFIATVLLFGLFSGRALTAIQVVKYSCVALSFSGLLGYVISASANNPVKLLFGSRFLLFSGRISYGLYVYHPICYWLIFKFLTTGYFIIDFSVCFAVTYVISMLSFKYFEMPFLKLKAKFSD